MACLDCAGDTDFKIEIERLKAQRSRQYTAGRAAGRAEGIAGRQAEIVAYLRAQISLYRGATINATSLLSECIAAIKASEFAKADEVSADE